MINRHAIRVGDRVLLNGTPYVYRGETWLPKSYNALPMAVIYNEKSGWQGTVSFDELETIHATNR